MKKVISSIIAVVFVTLVVGFVGCQKEESVSFDSLDTETLESLDLETQMWIESILDKANSNSIIYRNSSDGIISTKINPIKNLIPRLKSGSESDYKKPDSSWTSWGVVSGVASGIKMSNFMKDTYGDNCYETRIEPARDANGNLKVDKNGNPTGDKDVYHRPCQ